MCTARAGDPEGLWFHPLDLTDVVGRRVCDASPCSKEHFPRSVPDWSIL